MTPVMGSLEVPLFLLFNEWNRGAFVEILHEITPTSGEIQKLNEIDAFFTSSPTQNLHFERVFLFFWGSNVGGVIYF